MNFKGKRKIIDIIERIHLYVFGHKMSDKMRIFLGNLTWSFFGGLISGILFFISTVIAGRQLGPEEFGKYNVVIMVSQLLLIPMLLGMDISSTRFISQVKNKLEQSNYINTSLGIVSISVFTVSGIFLLLRDSVVNWAHLDDAMVPIIIVASVSMSGKMLLDAYMRGLKFFEYQAIIRIIEASIVMGLLILFLFILNYGGYSTFALSMIIGACVVIMLYFMHVHKYINIKPNFKVVKQLFGYGKFVILGSIFGVVLTLGDRFLINTFLGSEKLGIYMAYYAVSVSLMMQLTAIGINVFFPNISDIGNKIFVMKKIDRLMMISFTPITLFLVLFIFLAIHLFGQEYPMIFKLVIFFATLGALQFFVPFYASVVNVHSRKTYFWGLSLLAVRSVIFVLYVILMIVFDCFTMYTLLIGLILNYVVDIFNLRFIIKKYATKKV